jgi:penicillin amidase
VFERIPLLRDLVGFHVETDGDYYTVNRGASRLSDANAPFAHIHGAGYRAVYDLSDPEASLFIAVPGQSGLPQSPHWGDLATLWAAGRHFPIRRDEPGNRLTLTPQ